MILLLEKKPGYFKDEVNGKLITEFIGLEPKIYAFKVEDDKEQKAKGAPKNIVKKGLKFRMCKPTLEDDKM